MPAADVSTLFAFDRCTISSFQVPSSRATLQSLIDRALEVAEPGTTLSATVAAVWVHVIEGDVVGADLGPCRIVLLGVPVRQKGQDDVTLFCPYVFVTADHPALCLLREQLGYPAWGADIQITRRSGTVKLTLRTDVYVPGAHAPRHNQEILRLEWPQPGEPLAASRTGLLATNQLLQIRETTSPVMAVLRQPVRLVWEGELDTLAPAGAATVRATGGFRNIDLVADLGLPSQATTVPPVSCAFGRAGELACRLGANSRSMPAVLPMPSAFVEVRIDPREPPPYQFEDVSITGFQITADPDRLQFLVDALLNTSERLEEPRQYFRYVAATSQVVIEAIHYGKMQSLAPATAWRSPEDFTTQSELAFRFLVGRVEDDSHAATDPQVFCPFLFVDNWTSMVSGREVLGLWKRMGQFRNVTATLQDPDVWYALGVDAGRDRVFTYEHLQAQVANDCGATGKKAPKPQASAFPWAQRHFRNVQFRRNFARDWFRLSGQQYKMIQRRYLPQPSRGPALRQWVQMQYTIDHFQVAPACGTARLVLGHFHDPELVAILSAAARAWDRGPVPGLNVETGRIDIAELLGVQEGRTLVLPPSDWYLSQGSFGLSVIDRLG